MGTLYLLTSPVGKSYIGISSKTTEKRWAKHVEHAMGKRDNGALYAALRKYGPETFTVQTLVVCDDWEYLCELEVKAIAAFGTRTPDGYNISAGGEGVTGKRDEEFKKKVSVAQRKRFERPEERARMKVIANCIPEEIRQAARNRAIEKIRTPEYRGRASSKSKQQFSDPEARKKLSDAVRASVTEESRAAASDRTKTLMQDPALRRKIGQAVRIAMSKPETVAKVLAAARARATNPEWRGKVSAAKIGKPLGPMQEARKAKISAARKKEWSDPVKRKVRLQGAVKARETLALKKLGAPHPDLQQAFDTDPNLINKLKNTRDELGRYQLTFIHRIAGGAERHRVKHFLALKNVKELISTLSDSSNIPPIKSFRGTKGTFGLVNIAIAYAHWIDPTFRDSTFHF